MNPAPTVSDASRRVTDQIGSIVLRNGFPRPWLFGFALAFGLLMLFNVAVMWVFARGIGVLGNNIPVAWAFPIINFVWWIGIGHAGTFISAILLLLHQEWRTSINRFTEAMTLFAVACAGTFPLIHLGRPWLFFWLLPYPNVMNLWPQFRSPLVWDVFAVSTYATVSLVFWYIGLMPDLASLRDRAKTTWRQRVFGVLALGWRGSAIHWHRYKTAYLLLAGLATPLVLSVHSVVSFDFSVAMVPGWHSTIFPPYFVAGAIFSGFGMVLTLILPIRKFYRLENLITAKHVDNAAKVMLVTGLIVAHGYLTETFMAWYSGNIFEKGMMWERLFGHYAASYWVVLLCNVVIPQALWSRRVRANLPLLFCIAIAVNVGMWLERYVIIVVSLQKDFLPSSWHLYHPTVWDFSIFVGSLGLFFSLLFLFIRFLPMISMHEMREQAAEETKEGA